MALSPAAETGSRFYADLRVVSDLADTTRPENCAPLPEDWHVALCDVRNSTIAIQTGSYKNVNTLGAAAITAVLNASGGLDIPFGFEGDGCVLCVPPHLLEGTRAALSKTREIATGSFGLDLRIGTVPMADIRTAGFDILVARYRVTEHYDQAVFSGGGMAHADRLLKDPRPDNEFLIPMSVVPHGSMEGFECRWQDVPSRHGETVSLIVRALSPDPEIAGALYRLVIAKVGDVYGSPDACHPLAVPDLAFGFGARQLANEAGVRAADRGPFGKWLWKMRMRWFALLGTFLMKFGLRTEETDWSTYKETLVRNSDVRKLNDGYRQILAGTAAQRKALDAWLDERYRNRELVYGIHTTNRAQMTCLVFNYAGKHMHFIDGADGGLFLAAKELKQRLAQVKADSPQI
jgi:Protein of unknown function (DUF3095)